MGVPIFPQLALSASTYGAQGVPFGSQSTINSTTGSTFVIPVGQYLVVTGSGNVVEYSPNAGGSYQTLMAASSGGYVWADGVTVRFRNTGATTATYTQLLGGMA